MGLFRLRPALPLAFAATALACIFVQPALAQTARSGGSGGGAQNAQLVQQLQQLAAERTAMQAEQTRMKREIEDLKKERDALKASKNGESQRLRAQSEAAVARSARERETSEAELAKLKASSQELIARFRETVQSLREVETDRTAAKQSLTERTRDLEACVASNNGLYELNDEILTHVADRNFFHWSRAGQLEPFSQLMRVRLDNLIEGYRSTADDRKLSLGAGKPPSPPAAAAPQPR